MIKNKEETDIDVNMTIPLLVSILLFVSSWIDIRKKQVSIWVLGVFGLMGIVVYAVFKQIALWQLFAGIGIGLFIIVISKLTKGGIGAGDGGILCVTGLYLGLYQNMELLLTALVLAAFWSVALLVLKKAGRKSEIPFVPFMMAAYMILLAT